MLSVVVNWRVSILTAVKLQKYFEEMVMVWTSEVVCSVIIFFLQLLYMDRV